MRLSAFKNVEDDEPFDQLPLIEGLELSSGQWDYFDGPLSGDTKHDDRPLVFWAWRTTDGWREYLLIEADAAQRETMRGAESWESICEKCGDCAVVGRTRW